MIENRQFELGSQWRTSGGWRAVVVDYEDNRPIVWHSEDGILIDQDADGYHGGGYAIGLHVNIPHNKKFEPVPWVEPQEFKGWCNVWARNLELVFTIYDTKDEADGHRDADEEYIACIPVEFTQGDGLK